MNKLREENSEFQAQKGRGRPKGSPNKATKTFRETVTRLLEENEENVSEWLREVAEGNKDKGIKPDPKGALDLLTRMAEYATPKLSRSEMTGADNGPIQHQVTWAQ
jgi:phage terminase large subunit-like protein